MLWHKTRWASAAEENRLSHHTAKPGRPQRRQGQPIPTTPTAAKRLAAVQASSQQHKISDNEFKANRSYTMPDTVPLVTISAELGQNPNLVAARVNEHIIIDDETGLRCLPASVCRWLIDEAARAIAARRERDRAARAAQGAQSQSLRERIAARAREQEQMRKNGLIDSDTPAMALVVGGDKLERLNYKGRQFESYLRGESSFVPIRQQSEE